jgi:hypothetical protein
LCIFYQEIACDKYIAIDTWKGYEFQKFEEAPQDETQRGGGVYTEIIVYKKPVIKHMVQNDSTHRQDAE